MVSALNYSGEYILIYITLKQNNDYKILLYDGQKDNLRSPSPEYILNLIECTPETEVALVEADLVEELADMAIKKWCDQNQISEEEVTRECTLYLKPNDSENSIKKLLRYEDPEESEATDWTRPSIRPVERVAKRRLKVLHDGEFISYLDTTLGMTRLEANLQEQSQLLQEASAILGKQFNAK